MGIDKDELEGGLRLGQVRRVKKYLMIVQLVLVLAAVVFLILTGGKVRLKPFYFDVGSFLYFVILMALVMGVEGFIFRLLEMRYTKSSSAKYYMLKTSLRRGLVVIAVCAVVMALVLTPFLANFIANLTSEVGRTGSAAAFLNRDPLGLTTVDRVHVVSDKAAEVLIVSEASYRESGGDADKLRQHAVVSTADASPGVDLIFPNTPFGKFFIVVLGGESVKYMVHKVLSPTFVGFVALFATLFIGFYSIWIFYTYPLSKRYAKGAIYR